MKTFLRKQEKLKDKDGRWPVVSYLETEKGVGAGLLNVVGIVL